MYLARRHASVLNSGVTERLVFVPVGEYRNKRPPLLLDGFSTPRDARQQVQDTPPIEAWKDGPKVNADTD